MQVEPTENPTITQQQLSKRLGKCEVCAANDAKYTCPKCEVKTCCLSCLKIHKKELECDGIRDKTKYIPLKKMTKMDLMSDYNFLEECTRYVQDRKRDKLKKYTKQNNYELPTCMFRLRAAALTRGTELRFLLPNFTRSKQNTTRLDYKTQIISWKIEWNFPNAGEKIIVFVDDQCNEEQKLIDLCLKYIDGNCLEEVPRKKELEFYHSKRYEELRFLLRAEGVRRSGNRFFNLDPLLSLKENFKGKMIVEYPVIFVVFADFARELDLIDSDEDLEEEKKEYYQLNRLQVSQKEARGFETKVNDETKMEVSQKEVMPKSFFFIDDEELDAFSDGEIE